MARTLQSAFNPFVRQMNSLLHATLTIHPLQPQPVLGGAGERSFAFGGDGYAALHSAAHGALWLFLAQRCRLSDDARLETIEYSYGIGPADQFKPTLRWDYRKRLDAGQTFCRHHLQGKQVMKLGTGEFELDDLHLPTGYVPIEEIIRFCINDLGVPPRSDDWDERLTVSCADFRARLAGAPPEP